MLLSVIVPVYNVEPFLRQCLDSVIKQTLKDIEIICVNDGSTDGSLAILKQYANSDRRIVLINKECGGLSSARNAGLDIATGDFVYFLDSDDYLSANALKRLTKKMITNDLDMIFFNAVAVCEDDAVHNDYLHYQEYYKRPTRYHGVHTGIALMAQLVKNKEYRPAACLSICRRSLIEEHGVRFIQGVIHEDNAYTFETMMRSKKVMLLNDAYYHRRVRTGSIMTSLSAAKSLEGYFICVLNMMSVLKSIVYTEQQGLILGDYLSSTLDFVTRLYPSLTEQQVEELFSDSDSWVRVAFHVFIVQALRKAD
jgi:glycosyltransferase involved in cell wall biosynthesis